MIAAIYARKSTEQTGTTEEARSVARQIERATAFATSKGWTVSKEHVYVDDGVSGALFDKSRAGYQRLALERPRFQALVMSEPSRLGRESVSTSSALQRITDAGVEVWTYLDGRQHKMDRAIDKAMFALSGFTAEAEREAASTRTHDALKRKAERGHVTGGRCYGYVNRDVVSGADAHGRPKRTHVVLEIHPEQAAIVRLIFTRYARVMVSPVSPSDSTRRGCPRREAARARGPRRRCARSSAGRSTPAAWSGIARRRARGGARRRPGRRRRPSGYSTRRPRCGSSPRRSGAPWSSAGSGRRPVMPA
jgi:DNA invertase Pin-like site-specific DNA recombinase